jgi:hypothetical protein
MNTFDRGSGDEKCGRGCGTGSPDAIHNLTSFPILHSSRGIVHGTSYFKVTTEKVHEKINFSFKRLDMLKRRHCHVIHGVCVGLCLYTHSILGKKYIPNEATVRYAVNRTMATTD